MDYKITKKRLNDHLSYDWIKYICLVLAAVLLWSLIFTMTGIRIPNNKTFNMYFILPGVSNSEIEAVSGDISGVLNETTIDVSIHNWSPSAKETPQLIQTRFATQEGDMFLVDNRQRTGDDEIDKTLLSSFNGYVDDGIYTSLEDVMVGALAYQFDESQFRARVKKERKFNKIDSEEQMQVAIATEKERIQNLKDAATKLAGYLGIAEKLGVLATTTKIDGLAYSYARFSQAKYLVDSDYADAVVEEEKVWGINVAEVNGKLPLPKIKNLIWYANDDDKESTVIREYALGMIFTAQNMPYTYANLQVYNYLIERYK